MTKVRPLICAFTLLVILSPATPLFSDRIHLTTGVVIKGRILKVNDASVEYDPDGDRPFDIVSRRLVRRIVYDDGSVVEMMGAEEQAPMDDAAADRHKDRSVEMSPPKAM
jgi:hypothetical protein